MRSHYPNVPEPKGRSEGLGGLFPRRLAPHLHAASTLAAATVPHTARADAALFAYPLTGTAELREVVPPCSWLEYAHHTNSISPPWVRTEFRLVLREEDSPRW